MAIAETTSSPLATEERTKSVLFDDDVPTGAVSHTPIIITDGSASIEFAEDLYRRDTSDPNRRISDGLHLVKISASQEHPAANVESVGRMCVPLIAGEFYEIEVTCSRNGQPPNRFVIGGGPTFSPVITFEHRPGQEYQKDSVNFPSIQLGQRFGNRFRDITSLQIFKVDRSDNTRQLIHSCGVAPLPGVEYTMLDIH